jgi:four helix bundle protein
MHKYRELKVWQRAMAFTVSIYRESQTWPGDERFGLISQIRRAATSIPLNIAEGAGNDSNKSFVVSYNTHFVQIMNSPYAKENLTESRD